MNEESRFERVCRENIEDEQIKQTVLKLLKEKIDVWCDENMYEEDNFSIQRPVPVIETMMRVSKVKKELDRIFKEMMK